MCRIGIWFPVRGKYDSFAGADFVSEEIILRAQLEHLVSNVEQPVFIKQYKAEHEVKRKIDLTFQINNDDISHTREFYVTEGHDYDMILGEEFLHEFDYEHITKNDSLKKTFKFFMLKIGRKDKSI